MSYEEGYDYSDILLKALKDLRSSLEYSVESIDSLIDDYNLKDFPDSARLEDFSDTSFKDTLDELVRDWSSLKQNTEIVKCLKIIKEAHDWIEDHEKY